jgi:hypothetical protein
MIVDRPHNNGMQRTVLRAAADGERRPGEGISMHTKGFATWLEHQHFLLSRLSFMRFFGIWSLSQTATGG